MARSFIISIISILLAPAASAQLTFFGFWQPDTEAVVVPGDSIRPAMPRTLAILGYTTTSATATLTAVGDDSLTGRANLYDVRYSATQFASEDVISNAAFETDTLDWTPYDGTIARTDTAHGGSHALKVTATSGWGAAYFTFPRVGADTAFVSAWVYMTTSDTVSISVASQDLVDFEAYKAYKPTANTWTQLVDTVVLSGSQTTVNLVLQLANAPTARRFFIDDVTMRFSGSTWASGNSIVGEVSPATSGATDTILVSGLGEGTQYYIALKVADEAGNYSRLSNVVRVTTAGGSSPLWAIDSTKRYQDDFSRLVTYHVKPTGNDGNTGQSEATAWQTIDKANNTLQAGEMVLIHAGTYTDPIAPVNTGDVGNPIVYRNYATDVCSLFVTSGNAIEVISKDAIIIQGIRVQKADHTAGGVTYFSNANYCAILDSRIYGGSTYNNDALYGAWIANEFTNVQYLRLIGNYFDRQDANITNDAYRGENVEINGTSSKYVIVENNTFTNTSHYGISAPTGTGSGDAFVIIRNNVSYNNHCGGGNNYVNHRALYEGNRFFRVGQINTYKDGQSLEVIGSDGIYRYNMLYDDGPASAAIIGETVNNLFLSDVGVPTERNRVYNNAAMGNSLNPKQVYAISFYNAVNDAHFGQVLMNNIIAYPRSGNNSHAYFWQNQVAGYVGMDTLAGNALWSHTVNDTIAQLNTGTSPADYYYTLAQMKANFPNQWKSTNIESPPIWADSATTGLNRNFTLADGSRLIDAGVPLTTVTSTVNASTVIPVGDATFFHYDWGNSPYDRGDSLLVGSTRIELDSIDYGNKRLIAKSPVTVSSGANVHVIATFETARGYIRRLFGSAPDIGPSEKVQ